MDYNFFIPDIYNYNSSIILNKKDKHILHKSLNLIPNKYYNLLEIFHIDCNDPYYYIDNDNIKYTNYNICGFYFKTNNHKIQFYINASEIILIHNNFFTLPVSNRRPDNIYELFNIDDINHEIEVYIIFKNKYYGLVCNHKSIYAKNIKTPYNLFYCDEINKYKSHYYSICQTYNILMNFYIKTNNDNFPNIIKFESINIIFYFKYNHKNKLNNKYLYKYNLIKLEDINTNEFIMLYDNNMILSDINIIYDYYKKIYDLYDNVIEFLFEKNNKKMDYGNDYYLLNFKQFMIKNDIKEIFYNKVYLDV